MRNMRNTRTDITHKNFLQFALSAMASLPTSFKKGSIVLENEDSGVSKEVTSTTTATSSEIKSLNEMTSGGGSASSCSEGERSSSSSSGDYPGGYEMVEEWNASITTSKEVERYKRAAGVGLPVSPGKEAANKAAASVLMNMRKREGEGEIAESGCSGVSAAAMKIDRSGLIECGNVFLHSRLIMQRTCIFLHLHNEYKANCECVLLKNFELATESGRFPGHYTYAPSRFLSTIMKDEEVYKSCGIHARSLCYQWQIGIFIPNLGFVILAHLEFAGNVQLFLKTFHALTTKLTLKQRARVLSFYVADHADEFNKVNLYMNMDTHDFVQEMRAFFAREIPCLMKSVKSVQERLYWKRKLSFDDYSCCGFVYLCTEQGKKKDFREFPNGEIILAKCAWPAATELLYKPSSKEDLIFL